MTSLAKSLVLVTTVLMTSAADLRAGTKTTSMKLTGVGDGATFGDVYVDPYAATVGGVGNTIVICDDWSNATSLGETWTATVINAATVSNSALGTPMFGNNQQLYNELAWLGSQLLANATNPTQQTEISFAMWDLSYGIGSNDGLPGPLTYMQEILGAKYSTNSEYEGTENYINEAEGEGSYNTSGWRILTPDAGTQTQGDSTPQEFMAYTATPEPSQYETLAADLLLFAAAMLVLRHRGLIAARR